MLPTLRGTLHKPAAGAYAPTDADAIAWFAAVSGSYSDAEKLALNTYFSDLKTASLWSKFDRLWGFNFGDTEPDSRIDFKTRLSVIPVNTPSWTRRQGYTGNGTSSYLNTQFNPSTNGVNHALNSASVGAYIRSYDVTTAGFPTVLSCLDSGGRRSGITRDTNTAFQYAAINESAGGAATSRSGNGFYLSDRPDSTTVNSFVNGTKVVQTRSSLGLPQQPFYVFARNNTGTVDRFGIFQISMVYFGSSFSESEWASFRSITSTFLSAIGFVQP